VRRSWPYADPATRTFFGTQGAIRIDSGAGQGRPLGVIQSHSPPLVSARVIVAPRVTTTTPREPSGVARYGIDRCKLMWKNGIRQHGRDRARLPQALPRAQPREHVERGQCRRSAQDWSTCRWENPDDPAIWGGKRITAASATNRAIVATRLATYGARSAGSTTEHQPTVGTGTRRQRLSHGRPRHGARARCMQ